MFYSFFLFLFILAILSPVNAYNRLTILKDISIENEVVIISSGILFIYILSLILRNKEIIPKKIETKTIGYLILNIILTCVSLYLGGMIIQRSNVMRFKALQKPIYLVILVIISCLFYEKKCNIQTIFGIILLVVGCIIVDKNLK
jgi:uncharacterized membrane protein